VRDASCAEVITRFDNSRLGARLYQPIICAQGQVRRAKASSDPSARRTQPSGNRRLSAEAVLKSFRRLTREHQRLEDHVRGNSFVTAGLSMPPIRRRTRVIFVDCDPQAGRQAKRLCEPLADIELITSFQTAKRRLLQREAQLLVTNLRLDAYNGLHLIYLASGAETLTRCIVYSAYPDLTLIEEAQAAGAMYERASSLPHALPSYIFGELPRRDRRSPLSMDRRQLFRGGRRAADIPFVASL
jgi:hypothetical protein